MTATTDKSFEYNLLLKRDSENRGIVCFEVRSPALANIQPHDGKFDEKLLLSFLSKAINKVIDEDAP